MKSCLAGVKVGDGFPVRLMGVINVSPESFYKGSVENKSSITKTARRMEEEGADFIDIGALSTAPYLKTAISETEEAERLAWAVKLVRKSCRLPISIDTSRGGPARAGLNAGASILNDVHGLQNTSHLGGLLSSIEGLILMAHPSGPRSKFSPIQTVKKILQRSLAKARRDISFDKIVVDPGIGFFRNESKPWWKWDVSVLHNLESLRSLQVPILVGVSRKSFIGHLLGGVPAKDRLVGSLAVTAWILKKGVHILRTHDVAETKDVVRIMEGMSNAGADGARFSA